MASLGRLLGKGSDGSLDARRYRMAAVASATAALYRLVSLVTVFVSVPLTMGYLGPQRFGVLTVVQSISVFLQFADLGIGNGLSSYVAEAAAADDTKRVRQYVSSAFGLMAGIAAAGCLLAFALVPRLDWSYFFGAELDAAGKGEAMGAAMVLCLATMANLGVLVAQKTQIGLQRGYVNNLWILTGNLLSLGGLIYCAKHRLGLVPLIHATMTVPLVCQALNFGLYFARNRQIAPRLGLYSKEVAKRLLRAGGQFAIIQVCVGFISAAPLMLVAHAAGPDASAGVAVVQRVLLVAYMTAEFLWVPLWPAYADAYARGDMAFFRRTIVASMRTALAVMLVGATLVVLARPLLERYWLKGLIAPPLSLYLAVGLVLLLRVVRCCISMPVNAILALRGAVLSSIVVTVMLSAVLAVPSGRLSTEAVLGIIALGEAIMAGAMIASLAGVAAGRRQARLAGVGPHPLLPTPAPEDGTMAFDAPKGGRG